MVKLISPVFKMKPIADHCPTTFWSKSFCPSTSANASTEVAFVDIVNIPRFPDLHFFRQQVYSPEGNVRWRWSRLACISVVYSSLNEIQKVGHYRVRSPHPPFLLAEPS
jgi:hypothetical protein